MGLRLQQKLMTLNDLERQFTALPSVFPLHGVVVPSGTGDGCNGPAMTLKYDLTFQKTDSTINGVESADKCLFE